MSISVWISKHLLRFGLLGFQTLILTRYLEDSGRLGIAILSAFEFFSSKCCAFAVELVVLRQLVQGIPTSKSQRSILAGSGRAGWRMDVPGRKWTDQWLGSVGYFTDPYKWDILGWNNPLILTIDPNFQRDIQAGVVFFVVCFGLLGWHWAKGMEKSCVN